MEARTGNRTSTEAVAKAPRDRVLPLKFVEFLRPVHVPGIGMPLKTFERGKQLRDDLNTDCPKLFLDPELQAVVIEGRHFPLHLVFYFERSKTA